MAGQDVLQLMHVVGPCELPRADIDGQGSVKRAPGRAATP